MKPTIREAIALATPSPAHEPPFITCDDCGAKLTDMRCIETTEDRCWHKNCPTPSPKDEMADAYRDARLETLRGLATELERRLANVIALSENVLRGQVWPHSGNSFAQAIADAARGKQEATPSQTIAAPSPSKEGGE